MEKLIFEKRKKIYKRNTEVMRVRTSTLEILEEIEEETKLSRQEILDRMVKFAYEHLEYDYEEE